MYLDFPNTFQQTVNLGMQPLTYAVTIPSALSLYSLGFTIYRSDFQWTPAAKFLAVGMVSWLVAGLQGVGLATIQYDALAHNTLWVVGHFHNMALLNIGLVVFAGGVRVRPQAHRAGVAQQPPRRLAPRPDRRRRLRQRRPVDAPGARGRAPALGDPARTGTRR